MYNEWCNCPQPSLSKWLSAMQCPPSYEQITRDLSQFGKIDMTSVAREAMDRFSNRGAHSLCHYVIKDNKVRNVRARWRRQGRGACPLAALCGGSIWRGKIWNSEIWPLANWCLHCRMDSVGICVM